MTDLHYLTVADASRRIAKGRLSPVDLVDASLDRIAELNKKLHAFVLVLADDARKAARKAHGQIKAGRRIGPLHGIPLGLKDIYSTRGIRTTAHSKVLLRNVPKSDSTVAAKLGAAGMVLVGKLATHEFATGGPAKDLPFPPAVNPWKEGHFTGGSSSGSGAAIAAGLVTATMGSDTSGSIRGPSAFCGIAGFKPTYGLVSRAGVYPLSFSLDHCGPMTWTLEDGAMLLDAVAGPDTADPASSAPEKPPGYTRALKDGIRGMRVGIVRRFYEKDVEATREARKAIEEALLVLKKLGARLVDVQLPALAEWDACCRVILQAEAYAIHEKDLRTRPHIFARVTRERLLSGAMLSAADYIQALRRRSQLCRIYDEALAKVDVIVTGCSLAPAPTLDELYELPSVLGRGRLVMTPFNITGAPAASVCAGFSKDGLPLSLQIAAKPHDDVLVLRAGHAYEQAAGWRDRRPEL
ncbi:MAG: amidase [Alphaproteobacteria bacterium]|nr:amidase [Alphaproteobacteria bacterium]